MHISRTTAAAAAPAEWMTGEAWFETLASPGTGSRTRIDRVHFTPGARTVWHRHARGQVLIVTEGAGLVQRRGGPVETVRAGDTVRTAHDEWHWHGAAAVTAMTHLAVEEIPDGGDNAEAGDAVTDAEYYGHERAQTPESGVPVVRSVLLDQPLPAPQNLHRVEVRRITIAPGYASGLHVHNSPVFGSIESGSAVYQVECRPPVVLGPGAVFYEPKNARIARFDAQEHGVTFLAYFLLDAGQSPEIGFPAP